MNPKLLSGLSAILLVTASTATSCQAQQTPTIEQKTETDRLTAMQPATQPVDAIKEGEYRSPAPRRTNTEIVAKVEPHEIDRRQAATLYVRDIPILTFLGSASTTDSGIKVGNTVEADRKEDRTSRNPAVSNATDSSANNPVWRATAVAAKLNQLNRDGIDANSISVVWNSNSNSVSTGQNKASDESYIIKANDEKLVEIDADTRLAGSINNLADDALLITNRLRRLIGNAPPLSEIAGRPAPKRVQIALTTIPVVSRLAGIASWYGPGFHGNRSANGEIYDQNALTAAHRSLPFGTQVRVTNQNNGLSVVVRINDRGPYIHGRIIDLSAAAARTVGILQTGVAPVSVEVLGKPQTVATDEN